jgi:hypothetical protein
MNEEQVNHPKHYNSHPSGIECIEIVRHMGFNLGNVVKYVWREGMKDASLQELKKAAWYLNDEIKKLERFEETKKGIEGNEEFKNIKQFDIESDRGKSCDSGECGCKR